MKIYQRFLSKSLIFFSILFIVFLLFIESNIGFKWIFKFTNRFFVELKVEKISGNWRDFLLENIKYDVLGISIRADSVHVKLDATSLFKKSTIFKEIQTKNLIILLKKNISTHISHNHTLVNILKNKFFIKYPIIFKKIDIDQCFVQSSKINIFFQKIFTGIKLVKNNMIISPTYINNVNIVLSDFKSSQIIVNKKNIKKTSDLIQEFINTKKVYNILHILSSPLKVFIPFNLNVKYVNCKKVKLMNYKDFNLFQIELKAQIKDNIFKINRININSSFFKMKSFGKIIFHHNSSISSVINNKIIIPELHNKIINISFKSLLNKKFIFILKSKELYKLKINGSMLLNNLDYPFYIQLHSNYLFSPIRQKYIFNYYSFHGFIKGKINNYLISLKNIFHITGLPLIFFHIQGKGDLKNIFFEKIKLFPLKRDTKFYNDKKFIQDHMRYNKYILKLIGKMNIFSNYNNNIKNLSIPNLNLSASFMKKKISILGSLYYQSNNILNIPRINMFIGSNKLSLQGCIGKEYDINSSLDAYNLDYVIPNLKGIVKAHVNFHSHDMFPVLSGNILARNVYNNNTYVKNIKMSAKMNIHSIFSGKILLDAKKIRVHNFYIENLKIKTYLDNYKQKFYFLLKKKNFSISLIVNGIFNQEKGMWYGLFENINIKTLLSTFGTKKSIFINYHSHKYHFNHFYTKNIQKKEVVSLSFLYNKISSVLNFFKTSLVKFNSELFIKAKVQGSLEKNITNGEIFLKFYNIKLEKNQNKKIFVEKIDYLKVSVHLMKNNINTQWIVRKSKNSKTNNKIYGYLNIIDFYNKKNMKGKCVVINFPFSMLNFFSTTFNESNGVLTSTVKIFGTLDQPKILANVNFQDIFIRSNNLLKYITLFFPYFPKAINSIKINQEIVMKEGNVLFKLYSCVNNYNTTEWYLIFNSKKISVLIFPKIKVKFFSQLNLHYSFLKYDLIGFIKSPFFLFKINEKNFVF
ncbi:translocation/assembly module TamB [Buchnera aphidicola (Macrosiphoniella sanborni)]|uniref:Translocation/assembly module TamB n=1 Tax=Buchnera aphidicola (Macrosiphoniella sanborni) TaxID=1241865 RepID=A0A4D6YCF0_9GAMM|nr:translocation/assembly module TamB [Buchnera aphidicola]QCI23654.1 translocation/assembly module TamB [Buchnera aphidicola (Macrosiphoniella sanborni)]